MQRPIVRVAGIAHLLYLPWLTIWVNIEFFWNFSSLIDTVTKASDVTNRPETPLLDRVTFPADLKDIDDRDMPQLAEELRAEMIDAVSVTGGHLGAGLGVVELTLAIHKIFNTPEDRLIFDVGHQCYPHKILTGRRESIRTLRQENGLSGFTKRAESEYDPFGAAHSSTSISAGLGMAVASALSGKQRNVISVIGDGAMSAGMAYEALNNAGALDARLIVILNDNDMSIAQPTGAMSAYLARLASGRTYMGMREVGKKLTAYLGKTVDRAITRAVEHARGYVTGGTLFEELGFYHIGPIDGHNFDHLLPVLRNVRDNGQGPVLIHVVTQKGKGYAPAEAASDKYHGVSKFDVITGTQAKATPNAPSYTKVFADALIEEAAHDEKIVAIAAAMPSGTGLDKFIDIYPNRCCRTTRHNLCSRHGLGRLQAVCRTLFNLFAACLRSGCPRCGHPGAAGALCHRPGRLCRC